MKELEYTISIRTVGKGGEKYQKLLDSIKKSSIQPKEVQIILPEGYRPPKERLGYEQFLYSPKGMVSQRVFGGKAANTDYILFLDDDVEFAEDFVEKMARPILDGICECTIPPQLSMLPPEHGVRKIIPMLCLNMVPAMFNKSTMYTKVMKSGGSIYNRIDKDKVEEYLTAETAAGPFFFIKRDVFNDMRFEEELWLEDCDYAYPDDLVMFYKLVTLGYRIKCVAKAEVLHLDAGSGSDNGKRGCDVSYAWGRNWMIFWKKFIYNRQTNLYNKLISLGMYKYNEYMNTIILWVETIYCRSKKQEFKERMKGLKDGKEYIKKNNL